MKDILSKKRKITKEWIVSLIATCSAVNLPFFVAKRLSLGELTPTAMTLQMENSTLAHPEGILEDVLIKMGKFVFLVNFVVINIEEDKQVPLLLGRSFLVTGAALIIVKKR